MKKNKVNGFLFNIEKKLYTNLYSNFLIGFEFEFILEHSIFETKESKIKEFIKNIKPVLKNNKIFFSDNFYEIHNGNSSYKLTYDFSIKHDKRYFVPLELITPVMSLSEGIEILKIILDFFNKNKLITNKTTGFHVNLSFKNPEDNKNIDPLKLIFLSNDEYKINFWKRYDKVKKEIFFTTLVDPNLSVIKKILEEKFNNSKNIPEFKQIVLEYPEKILKILNNFKIMNKIIWLEKKQTINLSKLFNNNYVEFRLLGGENYHKRYDEIINEINYFVKLICKSTKKNYDKICIKKICKILNNIFFKNENLIKNEKIKYLIKKYDYIFSNNELMKYYVMKIILEFEKNNYNEVEENLLKLLSERIFVDKNLKETTKIFFKKLFEEIKIS